VAARGIVNNPYLNNIAEFAVPFSKWKMFFSILSSWGLLRLPFLFLKIIQVSL